MYEALAKRRPKSRTRGRLGTPAEVVLRLLLLKHIRNWSYEVLEREVRANLVYRSFTRVGGKLRVDTTVVETNIHYPTDSSLLGDGVRVLTRAI